jgi:ribosomal protein S18 acetylase RimI-like enzyme
VVRLNEAGTAADPRFRFLPDVAAHLREHFGHAWFGRFQPFPGCWVAEVGGERVGMVSGEVVVTSQLLDRPPTARIDNLWVEPAHRRAGIARALVDAFRARAVRAGFGALQVSTLHRDERAVAFWRSVGLTEMYVVLIGDPP